jgi:peptidyl-Lys metalloendopeptidase
VVVVLSQQLDVKLKKSFREGMVTFEITNTEKEAYRFLSYRTPFEEFVAADMFEITAADGTVMQYMGPLARRVSPAPLSAYIELLPANTLAVEFNLTQNYEIISTGFYKIVSKVDEFSQFNQGEEYIFLYENSDNFGFSNAFNTYTNCNPTEKSQVDSATNTAINQASRSYNCMSANSCRTLSDTWFGTYSTANYNYDVTCFYNIYTTLNSKGINAYCNPAGCGANVYAYVYPGDPSQTVYLCGAFWSQPAERPNTIVHEMSHFNVIAGTQDYTYGRASCKTLANNNPNQATRNADNVCYFSDEA